MSWSWWALASTLTLVVAVAAAWIVLRTRSDRPVNRRLSIVLALEGLFIGCSSGIVLLVNSPGMAFALGVIATATMVALIPQYLSFLGASLQTPLVAPFRGRTAMLLLAAASVLGAGFVILFAPQFVTEPYQPSFAQWNYQLREWGHHASRAHGLVSIFGLVAAISAYFITPKGSLRRTRAKWFAVAFGVRDLYVGVFQMTYPAVRPVEFWGDFVYNPGLGSVYLLYVVLLAYGVLQAQLFDIHVRIKFALRQSTIAAIITGAFFILAEILEAFVPVDGILIGVIAATICVLAVWPAKRIAHRLVNRVMSDVEEPGFLEARKIEVYRTALEGILDDDVVTPQERQVIERLRGQLGISVEDAALLEAQVLEQRAQSRPPPHAPAPRPPSRPAVGA